MALSALASKMRAVAEHTNIIGLVSTLVTCAVLIYIASVVPYVKSIASLSYGKGHIVHYTPQTKELCPGDSLRFETSLTIEEVPVFSFNADSWCRPGERCPSSVNSGDPDYNDGATDPVLSRQTESIPIPIELTPGLWEYRHMSLSFINGGWSVAGYSIEFIVPDDCHTRELRIPQ